MEAAVAMRSQYEEVGFGRSPDEGYGRVLSDDLAAYVDTGGGLLGLVMDGGDHTMHPGRVAWNVIGRRGSMLGPGQRISQGRSPLM